MAFCTNCGAQTTSGDRFCAHCGSAQEPVPGATASMPPPPSTPPPVSAAADPSANARMRPHIAALLCYLPSVGWLASVFFLTADAYRRNRYVHFHALQGLFLFVAYMLARTVFGFTPNVVIDSFSVNVFPNHWGISSALRLAVIVIQVVGMVKTAKGEPFHIPVIGDIAERSMAN